MEQKTRNLTLTAFMAAVLCVIGPVAVPLPVSPVPVSLTMAGIFLAVYVLGMWRGTLAYVIYLLLGLAGLPVFSGYTGGAGRLLGPTGGYLVGFLFTALISGAFLDRWWRSIAASIAGMALGMLAAYLFGSAWLSYEAGLDIRQAFVAGVLPYLAFDVAKIVLLAFLGRALKKALLRHGLLTAGENGRKKEKDGQTDA